jgi:hypothetical protein
MVGYEKKMTATLQIYKKTYMEKIFFGSIYMNEFKIVCFEFWFIKQHFPCTIR